MWFRVHQKLCTTTKQMRIDGKKKQKKTTCKRLTNHLYAARQQQHNKLYCFFFHPVAIYEIAICLIWSCVQCVLGWCPQPACQCTCQHKLFQKWSVTTRCRVTFRMHTARVSSSSFFLLIVLFFLVFVFSGRAIIFANFPKHIRSEAAFFFCVMLTIDFCST